MFPDGVGVVDVAAGLDEELEENLEVLHPVVDIRLGDVLDVVGVVNRVRSHDLAQDFACNCELVLFDQFVLELLSLGDQAVDEERLEDRLEVQRLARPAFPRDSEVTVHGNWREKEIQLWFLVAPDHLVFDEVVEELCLETDPGIVDLFWRVHWVKSGYRCGDACILKLER